MVGWRFNRQEDMGRCLHLDSRGKQCSREAEPGSALCYLHDTDEYAHASPPGTPLRKVVFRLVAALLLLLFALQSYQLLKALLDW